MKICRICQSFNPRLYELSSHLYPLTLEQANNNLKFEVISKQEFNLPLDEKINQNVNVHRFVMDAEGINNIFPFSSVYFGNQAYEIMKKLDYDIIQGHQPVVFGLCFKKLDKPFIYTIHDTVVTPSDIDEIYGFNTPYKKLINMKRRYSSYLTTKFLIKKADAITVVAPMIKEKLVSQYNVPEQKISVITSGVYTNIFKPVKPKVSSRIKILFVGRLIVRKGVLDLIKAIPLVLARDKSVEFIFVGAEKGQELYEEVIEISKKYKDNVKLVNMVNSAELPKYYNSADIYILPSITEGAAKTILEAMACQKPVIITKTTGYSDIVLKYECGLLINPGSPYEIKEAILRLTFDDKLRNKMGKNARRISLLYDWTKIAKNYTPLYESLLKK